MSRFVIDDSMWKKLEVLLPSYPKGGRPSEDNRHFLEAICWIVRTGAPWRDLPPDYGNRGALTLVSIILWLQV